MNFPLCLAPMVGLSHVALRATLRTYLPKGAKTLWPTEMLNSRRIPDQIVGSTPETAREDDEDGLVPQILGNQEEPIAATVALLEKWGAIGIDINMGCPVQKALRHNYGVALMGDPSYAAEVVSMTVRNSTVPVSVKLRAGPQGDFDFLQRFTEGLFEAGASWVTLHPRTAEQKRRGRADWDQIRRLIKAVQKPIIGNGDVQTAEDVFRMREETDCDMVMVGRALAARPWMLWQVGERLGFDPPEGCEGMRAPETPDEEGAEYGRALLKLIASARKHFPEELALRKIRFHIRTTSVWMEFGHTLISISTKAKNLEEMVPLLEKFFRQSQAMTPKTDQRE
ncbi:MAG TPA: tRNA-dihydrouridine synthase family protein [Pseudobdellovibrionaceae bacterium]|nr:tRNA-dihydrouridine synthase family protein [Pseudobdellovibrionaceae bacterium]